MLCGDLNGKEIQKKRGYVYMYQAFPGGTVQGTSEIWVQ